MENLQFKHLQEALEINFSLQHVPIVNLKIFSSFFFKSADFCSKKEKQIPLKVSVASSDYFNKHSNKLLSELKQRKKQMFLEANNEKVSLNYHKMIASG